MKTILTLVLSLGVLFLKAQDSLSTFYFPPFLSAQIDKKKWKLPYEEPLVMHFMANEALKNGRSIKHINSGLEILVLCIYPTKDLKEEMLTLDKDSAVVESYNPAFDAFYSSSTGTMSFIEKKPDQKDHFGVIIAKVKKSETVKMDALRDFMKNLRKVDASEIDIAVGYPLEKTVNLDSLRNARRKIYKGTLRFKAETDYSAALIYEEDRKFDNYFMRDLRCEFSFKEFHTSKIKDNSKNYTYDDYLSYWFEPDSIRPGRALQGYGANDDFKLPGYICTEFSRLGNYKSPYTTSQKLADKQGKNRDFVLLENDSMYNFLYAEKEKTGWTIKDHQGKKSRDYHNYNSRNTSVEAYYADRDKNFMLIFHQAIGFIKNSRYQEPGNISVMDMNNGLFETMEFSRPEKWNEYLLLVEYFNADMIHYRLSSGKASKWSEEYLGPARVKKEVLKGKAQEENSTSYDDYRQEYYDRWTPGQTLYASPVFFTDMDRDGNKEVCRVYVSNGKLISSVVYEKGSNGYTKITLDEVWKKKLNADPLVVALVNISKNSFKPKQIPSISDGYDDLMMPVDDMPLEIKEDEVLTFAQEFATYPGGDEALHEELKSLAVYPAEELNNKIEGTVFVELIVEKNGSISNAKVARGVSKGPGLSKAALEAVNKLSKKFTPAKQNGKPVRLRITIPVKFKL